MLRLKKKTGRYRLVKPAFFGIRVQAEYTAIELDEHAPLAGEEAYALVWKDCSFDEVCHMTFKEIEAK